MNLKILHLLPWKKACLFLLLLCFLHSCVLYPRYRRPCVDVPQSWRVASDESSTAGNLRWWQQWHDPVLDALIQEALENNKDLGAATARIAEFRARLGIASAHLFPQVAAQASFTRQRISQTTGNGAFPSVSSSDSQESGGALPNLSSPSPFSKDYLALFTASYDIDLWGKVRSATDAAFAELLGQVDARRALILSLVSSVAIAYTQLRQYDLQLTISIHTLQARQQALELAEVRFKEGLTSELEVKQAASEKDEAAIQVIQFQTLVSQQENLLSVLLGHPPASIPRGRSLEHFQLPPDIPVGLPVALLEQRPDILQAEKKLMAAHFRIGEARAQYFPDITLTGYFGYESSGLHEWLTNPSKIWQWMLSLMQPLFTGGRISNTVKLAKAQAQEAVYQYSQVILTALQEVNDALIAHQNAKQAIAVQADRVHDLQGYVHLAQLQYENGLVDYLNVLDAERRLFDAQLDLVATQANVFLSLIQLYQALGGGWVIDAENLMSEGTCVY